MKRKILLVLICMLVNATLIACGPSQAELDAEKTRIAVEVFATQTAEAPSPTPTPPPTQTLTPTSSPTLTPTPMVEAKEADNQAGDTLTLAETSTPTLTPVPPSPTTTSTPVPPTETPPPAPPTATPTPSQQWVLVADSAIDFPGPIQDRKWWYLWSEGRNNFIWQDMVETPECYESPNEMTLAICRDQIKVDSCEAGEIARRDCSRGDAALLWKAGEGGTYRFEWTSSEVDGKTTLKFYKHLDFWGSEPGSELTYSAIVPDVIQWELFFWVPQYDTPYHIKIYKLQE